MIKAVIFDLDGVLRDSERVNIIAGVKAFEEMGIHIKKEEEKLIIGRHPADYLKDFKENYDFDDDEYNKIKRPMYYKMIEDVPLNPYAKPLFKLLKNNNIKLALVTSSSKSTVDEWFIDRFELQNVFDIFVTFNDVIERKPSPECYLQALKKLNLKSEECVVIEDSEVGVEASKNAEIKCIAIPTEWTKNGDFSKADKILQSLKETTLELLGELQ